MIRVVWKKTRTTHDEEQLATTADRRGEGYRALADEAPDTGHLPSRENKVAWQGTARKTWPGQRWAISRQKSARQLFVGARTMSTTSFLSPLSASITRRRYGRCPARACRPRRRPVNSGCRALPPTQARAPRLVCTYLPISNANRIQPRSATALSRLSRGQNNRPSSSSERPGPLVIRDSAGSLASRKSYSSHPPFDRAVAVFSTLAGRVVDEGEVVGDLDEAASDGDHHAGGGAQDSRHGVADESIRRSRCAVPLALDCCQRWRTTISRRSVAAVCAALE
jgi:hypothetical protein